MNKFVIKDGILHQLRPTPCYFVRELVSKTIKVLDIYSKPNNKKSSSTPAKGATPAKKQKLGLVTADLLLFTECLDPSSTQNTPVQNEVTKQLHALLNNIPAENLSKLEKLKKTSGKLSYYVILNNIILFIS